MLAVALVAILGSLASSAYGSYRDRVRTKAAVDEIAAISMAIDQYEADRGMFPPDLAAIGRGGLQDPWGRAYVYRDLSIASNRGAARKDHSLVPLNSDYDLFSKGPDGMSASPLTAQSSKDDILRANNGRYIGRGQDY